MTACQECGAEGGRLRRGYCDACWPNSPAGRGLATAHARSRKEPLDVECVIDGCTREIKARGMCGEHYKTARDAGLLRPRWDEVKVATDALHRMNRAKIRLRQAIIHPYCPPGSTGYDQEDLLLQALSWLEDDHLDEVRALVKPDLVADLKQAEGAMLAYEIETRDWPWL